MFSFGQRWRENREEEEEERRKRIVATFYQRTFLLEVSTRLLQLFPRIAKPSRTFLILPYLITYTHYRSTALPITGLRDGSLNRPECPLTCARSSSTIALSSSISSFTSIFSPCSFAFSSLSLKNSVPEDVLGVFGFGDVLLGINLSLASTV